MKWSDLSDNWCPVARTLSVVGDRWTLLILRDCFLGKSKFEEFAASGGMTRHILADRLKRLVEVGILERRLYSSAPKRYDYVLTDRGEELRPALSIMKEWGKKHLPVRRSAADQTG
ncbi:MAG: winged helix-turn-helix transcriptional regulator [Hyphomonas sp.]